MAAKHSSRNIKRGNTGKIKSRKIILFVEGRNTEYSYFKQLKKSNCKIDPVPVRGRGIASCVDFVNSCINKFNSMPAGQRNTYIERWLVFDYDGHEDFADAIKLARKCGFGVAFSSMCIEYWFLLHFEEHSGKPIPQKDNSHSIAQIEKLNSHIKRYNKANKNIPVSLYDSDSKEICDDFYELMLAIDAKNGKRRIVNALERAKAIHETKKSQGAEFKESVTTIYELLLCLGVFELDEKTGEYLLYCK